LAVGLVAAGTLMYEILLVRVFAIEQFYHFAYMAIGVAMLGFGAAGTLLTLVGRLETARADRWFGRSAALTAFALIAAPAVADRIGVDPTQLAWNFAQWPRLGLVYLLLALPFGVGALPVLLGLGLAGRRPGRIYGASFLGSGAGALLATGVLWQMPPLEALAIPAVLAGAGAVAAGRAPPRTPGVTALAAVAMLVGLAAAVWPPWRLDITPYKALPQVEAFPDAVRLAERSAPLGWTVAVEAPAFRHAPGLSLSYRGEFPPQLALMVDGDIVGAASRFESDSAALALTDWLPSALPYALGPPRRVLVLNDGGGTEAWNALAHGAGRVTAVELVPHVVELTQAYAPFSSTAGRRVSWAVADARSLVARVPESFDVVSIGPAGGPGSAVAGVHALGEDFAHTVEAYVRYLQILTDGGVLAVTRWLSVPPRANVRVILTAAEALRRVSPGGVTQGLLVVRSWGTATTLIKPAGFTPGDVAALRQWAVDRRFDLDWAPGLDAPESAFHRLDEPTLFRAAQAAVAGRQAATRFAAAYPFWVAPATDDRPYPHHFLRGSSLRSFMTSDQGDWLPFAEWGYVALVATMVQSVVLAGLCLLLPTVVRTRSRVGLQLLPVIAYFGALGVAYLAAEIVAIQQLSLLLGHPVYAVVAVLTALLIGSGLGSMWSDRVPAGLGWRAAAALALLLSICAVTVLPLVHRFQGAPLAARCAVAAVVLAPLAFVMGMPFALGLRRLAGDDTVRLAWAWAANGFASVVAAPLAALIALQAGARTLWLVAAVAYGAAVALYRAAPPARVPPA
jgi:hypothetical protein